MSSRPPSPSSPKPSSPTPSTPKSSQPTTSLSQPAMADLVVPTSARLTAYCARFALLAIATDAHDVEVYRANGQRVFRVSRIADSVVDALGWKFDGRYLALAWSHGVLDVVETERGTVVQKVAAREPHVRVELIDWHDRPIDVAAESMRVRALDVSEVFANLRLDPFQSPFGAPIDLESQTPRLRAIPPPPTQLPGTLAASAVAYDAQDKVDALLHGLVESDHSAENMVRFLADGSALTSLLDAAENIHTTLPEPWKVKSQRSLGCATHNLADCYMALKELHWNYSTKIGLVPLSLEFMSTPGISLRPSVYKTMQLRHVLGYIEQSLQRVRAFWKYSRELPLRFMMVPNEALSAQNQGDLSAALYHAASTGQVPDTIREWLVRDLGDNGRQRWDHHVTTGLFRMLDLTEKNLLPALNRASGLLQRLHTLAQHQEPNWTLTVHTPPANYGVALEMVKSLRLLAVTATELASKECSGFAAFEGWLHHVMNVETTAPHSQARVDSEESDPGIDTDDLLRYIQDSLTASELEPLLCDAGTQNPPPSPPTYEEVEAAVALPRTAASSCKTLCMERLFDAFARECSNMFRRATEWQTASTRMDCGVVLDDGEAIVADMGMWAARNNEVDWNQDGKPDPDEENLLATCAAVVLRESQRQVRLSRLRHKPFTSKKDDFKTLAHTDLSFPRDTTIVDVKFADSCTLFVLLRYPYGSATVLLRFDLHTDFDEPKSGAGLIPFTPTCCFPPMLPSEDAMWSPLRTAVDLSDWRKAMAYERCAFQGHFQPCKMVVHGAVEAPKGDKSARASGDVRVVLSGLDRRRFRVVDVPKEGRVVITT